jgi:HPr kinase/phosphorylase
VIGSDAITLHGTCVALGERGVLILGDPGAGKSDLALRLIDDGAELVADDQVQVTVRGASLAASAPAPLAGLLEIRGIGIVRIEAKPSVELAIVIQLEKEGLIERMPEPEVHHILGVPLPLYRIDPAAASAPARVRAALRQAAVRGNVRAFPGGGHETMMTLKSKT